MSNNKRSNSHASQYYNTRTTRLAFIGSGEMKFLNNEFLSTWIMNLNVLSPGVWESWLEAIRPERGCSGCPRSKYRYGHRYSGYIFVMSVCVYVIKISQRSVKHLDSLIFVLALITNKLYLTVLKNSHNHRLYTIFIEASPMKME